MEDTAWLARGVFTFATCLHSPSSNTNIVSKYVNLVSFPVSPPTTNLPVLRMFTDVKSNQADISYYWLSLLEHLWKELLIQLLRSSLLGIRLEIIQLMLENLQGCKRGLQHFILIESANHEKWHLYHPSPAVQTDHPCSIQHRRGQTSLASVEERWAGQDIFSLWSSQGTLLWDTAARVECPLQHRSHWQHQTFRGCFLLKILSY